ncbi:M20 family metallopeptidase [Dactylosporangium fulvum]|uniref:M20 family metallopeptidase n=1 Tax=Dactylosporangium fulvum TaxID=53359 RepID=A0ABY5W684_9ACTN|nr:M20 family metallopeptidase [Dactylosporangium fulvum]UWP85568.1 M20 family metallopeptidase [Dactylosporangium fulvum]
MPTIIDDIGRLVRCESPSTDLAAVARSAEVVSALGTEILGVPPERIDVAGRTHLRWRLGSGPRHLLLLGHHDTVWPLGSLDRLPFSVERGVLRGPGCFDMKAGLVMAFRAIEALDDPDGLTILITGDEELGSPSSRQLIEEEAAGLVAVVVAEGAAPDGALKCARKGGSLYEVTIQGRAAHAGLDPGLGVNAAIEAAHHVLAVVQLADPETGTTVCPSLLTAGTTSNTVPASASFTVDVRVSDPAEQARVDAAMRSLRPVQPGAGITVRGGPNRAPMTAEASRDLFLRAAAIGRALGLPPLACAAVGGASDGNLTAAMGVPTIDGFGAVGGGAHADGEHVLLEAIPGRTALLSALLAEVLAEARDRSHTPDGDQP